MKNYWTHSEQERILKPRTADLQLENNDNEQYSNLKYQAERSILKLPRNKPKMKASSTTTYTERTIVQTNEDELDKYQVFREDHCLALDLLRAFDVKCSKHEALTHALPPIKTCQERLQEREMSGDTSYNIWIKAQIRASKGKKIEGWDDKNFLSYLHEVNNTLNELITSQADPKFMKIFEQEVGYTAVTVDYDYPGVSTTTLSAGLLARQNSYADSDSVTPSSYNPNMIPIVSIKSMCDKWLEFENSRLVQFSFKNVMLPSLGIFSLLTFVLYFISMYTDAEHLKKCKQGALQLKSSVKTKKRDLKRTVTMKAKAGKAVSNQAQRLQSSSGEPLSSILNDSGSARSGALNEVVISNSSVGSSSVR